MTHGPMAVMAGRCLGQLALVRLFLCKKLFILEENWLLLSVFALVDLDHLVNHPQHVSDDDDYRADS